MYQPGTDDGPAHRPAPYPLPDWTEVRRLHVATRSYVSQRRLETGLAPTEGIDAYERETSTFFEYDVSGARVVGVGQRTGGFVAEVAENEAAFSYALQDTVSLYLLKRVADSENPVELSLLDEVLCGSQGWVRLATLMKGGLLEVVGSQVRATERALTELNTILAFCETQRNRDVPA